MKILNTIHSFVNAFKDKLELTTHNEYNISNYFRKKGVRIGNNCRILVHDFGSEPYLVKIGNDCIIAPGVGFITHDAASALFRKEIPNLNIFGKIEIKDNCFIGARAIILYNVTIGPNSIIGAGSVVTKDVPPNSVYAGVPARRICGIEEFKTKCTENWQKLNLQGQRETWRKQLEDHFWGDKV